MHGAAWDLPLGKLRDEVWGKSDLDVRKPKSRRADSSPSCTGCIVTVASHTGGGPRPALQQRSFVGRAQAHLTSFSALNFNLC